MRRAPWRAFLSGSRSLKPPLNCLAHRIVGWKRCQLTAIETVGVPGLSQELFGARGIKWRWIDRECELEIARDSITGGSGKAKRLGLIKRLSVDRKVGGHPDPPVRPR